MELHEKQHEAIDERLKYVEMPHKFYNIANDIKIASLQQIRQCEEFAKELSRVNPKTPGQFEKSERMKQFLISTHDLNTRTVALIGYIHDFLGKVAQDANTLIEGAVLRDKLKEAGISLEYAWQQRDELIKQLNDRGKAS
jgi:hypothetical protein